MPSLKSKLGGKKKRPPPDGASGGNAGGRPAAAAAATAKSSGMKRAKPSPKAKPAGAAKKPALKKQQREVVSRPMFDDDDGDDGDDDDEYGTAAAAPRSSGGGGSKKPSKKADLFDEDEEEEEEDDDDDMRGMTGGFTLDDDLDDDDDEFDDGDDGGDDDDDDDDDDDGGDELPIERKARKLDAARDADAAASAAELKAAARADNMEVFHLPTAAEREGEAAGNALPPAALKERIDAIVDVLAVFKDRREPGRARQEYLDQLCDDLAEYYGYLRELIELFMRLFAPAEAVEFLEASDKPRPMVIRTNTLKTRRKDLGQALMKRGINLEPLAAWSKVGLKISESAVPIGATPEYLAGQYMLQSAASLCPVMALDPQPGERVLDMAAAPGGKTTYIAQLLKGAGTVIANDMKRDRQRATVANLHRLGVRNAVCCCHDGRAFPKVMGGFDRVLLDAPCSGLGVISRDQTVKLQRKLIDIQKIAHLQRELLVAAVDSCDHKAAGGGIVVYSTCSVSVEENEQVVQYILDKRHVKLVESGLHHGRPGLTRYQERRFHPSLALTRRFFPHVHNMDGFYVAKLQKISHGPKHDGDDK